MNATTKPQPTLAEGAERRVVVMRDELKTRAENNENPERLLEALYRVQRAEVEHGYEVMAQRMFDRGGYDTIYEARKTLARRAMARLITGGPDDRWSGRGNDLKRVEFDAQRDWISTVLSDELI